MLRGSTILIWVGLLFGDRAFGKEGCVVSGITAYRSCLDLIASGCSQSLSWQGASCLDLNGSSMNDGGCQTSENGVYCGWKCKSKCETNPSCFWTGSGCEIKTCNTDQAISSSVVEDVINGDFLNRIQLLRPILWSADGIGTGTKLSANSICAIHIDIVVAQNPDPNQLSVMEVRVYNQYPENYLVAPLISFDAFLTNISFVGIISGTAMPLYEVRFESNIPVELSGYILNSDIFFLFRFPSWVDMPFSFLSLSSVSPESNALQCAFSMGNITNSPVNLCDTMNLETEISFNVF
jgi:hypothetical protein